MLSAENKAALLLLPAIVNLVILPRYDGNSVTTTATMLLQTAFSRLVHFQVKKETHLNLPELNYL